MGSMVVLPAVVDLEEALAAWQRGLAERRGAIRQRQRAMTRAEGQLRAARGGVSHTRWARLVSGTFAVNTLRDSQAVNRALRRRAAVELAETRLAEVDAMTAANLKAAELNLRRAARRLAEYGPLGCRLAGRSLTEMRHLARPLVERCPPDNRTCST
jgi:hypothetical protein